MIGAVTAAGWKGYIQAALGKDEWGAKLPEALIPLGNGETMLSRQVRQFKERGARDVFVGVGLPGKTSPMYCNWLARGGYAQDKKHFKVDYGAEIWTQERLDYVNSLGCTAVPVQFQYTPSSFTVGRLLEAILKSGKEFDAILITMGDYVMLDEAFDVLLSLPIPCLWMAVDHHQGWLLDKRAAEFLSRWLLTSGLLERRYTWFDHLWSNLWVLKEHGIQIVENIFPGAPYLIEVETPSSYEKARWMIGITP